MENLNLLGFQVSSMSEAIEKLGCTKETLINSAEDILVNGFTFGVFTFRTENNKKWCYSITAINLNSKEHE